MTFLDRKKTYRMLDGFKNFSDGYTESPFGHGEFASEDDTESEYYMQWVYPLKLNRIALRTPVGFRLVYLYAKDLWNNRLGITILDDKDKTEEINRKLIPYLMSRRWFREMEKLSAFEREQGEAILMCYYDDEGDVDDYKNPVSDNAEILKVEAFNPLRYHIPFFDKFGDPFLYRVQVKTPNTWRGYQTVDVHPSRIMRKTAHNIEYRHTGYSDLAAVYDPIVILASILKSVGEAAFRWATGHPVFLTKDIFDEADLQKLKDALGNVTRKRWHAIPSEKIEEIKMIGQAGSMLNLKALADVAIDNIVMGSGFPKPVLLGEIAGVMGSEVSERGYFAKLDRDHTDLEWFVLEYFKRDLNLRKLLKGVEYFKIDWGIREVFNKMDDAEYKQKIASIATAMTTYASIDEAREYAGLEPLNDEYGELILGLLPFMEFQFNMAMALAGGEDTEETHGEPEEATSMKEKSASTKKKAASIKEPEKNKRVAPVTKDSEQYLKDALNEIRKDCSVNDLKKKWGMAEKTVYKILNWANE